jgi:hypothetical protein
MHAMLDYAQAGLCHHLDIRVKGAEFSRASRSAPSAPPSAEARRSGLVRTMARKLLDALLEIASEIRALRVMLVTAIAPALRDSEGMKTREGFLRTEEMSKTPRKAPLRRLGSRCSDDLTRVRRYRPSVQLCHFPSDHRAMLIQPHAFADDQRSRWPRKFSARTENTGILGAGPSPQPAVYIPASPPGNRHTLPFHPGICVQHHRESVRSGHAKETVIRRRPIPRSRERRIHQPCPRSSST